jgi:hypothetical protein
MVDAETDYGLEFLLTFDGHIHHLEGRYWIKFEIRRIEATKERPHGLVYSLTLHTPDGVRLLGFDNAHGVPAAGSRSRRSPAASDHWHRTENDPGRPYAFNDADTLLEDFFREVRRVLTERGVSYGVIRVEEKRQ